MFEGRGAYSGSSPCLSSLGSTGTIHQWGCRSHSRCTGTPQHNPSRISHWDTLETQGNFTAATSKRMGANHRTQRLAIRDKINYSGFSLMKQNSSGKQGKAESIRAHFACIPGVKTIGKSHIKIHFSAGK